MSWYRVGTISLANNSAVVTGVGTLFKTEVRVGNILLVNGRLFEIARVDSDTQLTIGEVYTGTSLTNVAFAVIRNLTNASNFELMLQIDEFMTDRQRSLDEFVQWINGPRNGGEASDGKFPLTDRYGVTTLIYSPDHLISLTDELRANTESLQAQAQAQWDALGDQQVWADQILGYKTAAEAAKTAAEAAKNSAATSAATATTKANLAGDWAEKTTGVVTTGKYSAKHHALAAETSRVAADAALADVTSRQSNVVSLESAAQAAKTSAESSATSAASSESAAATSATNAATSATNAAASATTATTKASEASASSAKAQKWADNPENTAVEAGKYSAKHHAIKAAASQADVAEKQSLVAASQADVASIQVDVTSKQADVVTRHTNVISLEESTQAAKTAAETAKTAAETAKTAAETAKTAAETARTTATTKASEASTSAATATTKASEASTSAATATTKASEASTSATNASASELKASKWADNPENTAVETGKYSAKHHALKAAASASAAAGSESLVTTKASEAAASAATASTKASEAASSASAAASSASSASSSASTATTKAGEAASSASSAASSKASVDTKHSQVTTMHSQVTTMHSEIEDAHAEVMQAAASVVGGLVEYGGVDLSGGAYPPVPSASGFWKVTVGGTVSGIDYAVGDTLMYSKNLTEFYKIDNTESITSVNGKSGGAITLTAADVGAVSTTGTAAAATKLATSRTISITGDGTGSASFNGTANAAIAFTLKNSGVTAGQYAKVQVDAKGIVIGGLALSESDIPNLDASKITGGEITVPVALENGDTLRSGASPGSPSVLDFNVHGVALFKADSNVTGAIVFSAPSANTAVMHQFEIDAYNYNPAKVEKILVAGYRYGSGWLTPTKVAFGSMDIKVRLGIDANGKNCIVLGDETTVWNYPQVAISRALLTFSGVSTAYTKGWTTELVTDLSGFSGLTSFIPNATSNIDTDGNAATASRLATPVTINGRSFDGSFGITTVSWGTPRTLSFTGDATGSAVVDGSANASFALTLANSGVTAGTYAKVTVNSKGVVTGGAALVAADIPSLDASKITTGTFAAARIPTLNQNTTGSAAKLTTARTISMTGDGTWSTSFDGSGNASGVLTLAASGVSAGEYGKVTVNAKGIVTGGAALAASDIPSLDASKITTGTIDAARIPILNQDTTGNAATATKLASIGTSFSGTYPMVINASGVLYSHANVTFTGSTGVLVAPKFSGDGAALTGLNASNIATGTISAARIPTLPISTVTGLDTALAEKVDNTDSRLTDAREWTASVVTQAEAEAGTSTTSRKWTAQRVRQAIVAGIASLVSTAKVLVGTTDDGTNALQVGGDASLRGNTGFGNDSPTHRLDVTGDVRVRDSGAFKMGGTGLSDVKASIQYNATTKSIDFVFQE